jgi:hypothetical protein
VRLGHRRPLRLTTFEHHRDGGWRRQFLLVLVVPHRHQKQCQKREMQPERDGQDRAQPTSAAV